MACDMCGKTGTRLADLLDSYKTDDIQSICPECEKAVDAQKRKLQTWTATLLNRLLKRFVQVRRSMS